jgi:hypothetical protein
VLAAPDHSAVDDQTRHAEHADRFRGVADGSHLVSTGLRLCNECWSIGTGFRQNSGEDGDILNIQLAPPETFEHRGVVAAEHGIADALRIQHPRGGKRRIPDFLRPANCQPAFVRLATAVHVAVAHATPLMRVAVLLQNAAIGIDARRAEEALGMSSM